MSNAITVKQSFITPSLGRFGLAGLARIAHAVFWAADRLVAASRQRQAIALLMAMDERQLKDLGIARGEIPAFVTGRFGRFERNGYDSN